MEAFKAKNKSMLRVVDEASDVSWGSRGNRESHPLVIMMVASKSFFQAMCSEGRDEFWCCYRRVRYLYKCWLEPKRPTYHISVVSGVLGKAAMKVREETKAPHTGNQQCASPCSQLHRLRRGSFKSSRASSLCSCDKKGCVWSVNALLLGNRAACVRFS